MINISKNNQRRIYLFYVIVFLSALGWRLASASNSMHGIEAITIEENEADTTIVISMNKTKRPVASLSGDSKCLVLDFPQSMISKKLAKRAFASRDLRLGYVASPSRRPDNVRVTLYLRSGCMAVLRYQNSDVIVRIAEKTALAVPSSVEPGFLLSPTEEKYAPAIISLHDAPLSPLIAELATLAGIDLELSGNLPEKVSVELQAASPLDALKDLAKVLNLEFVRRGQVWLLGPSTTEKPRIYAYSGDLLQ